MDYNTKMHIIPAAQKAQQVYGMQNTPIHYIMAVEHLLGEGNANTYFNLLRKYNGNAIQAWSNMPTAITKSNKFVESYVKDFAKNFEKYKS